MDLDQHLELRQVTPVTVFTWGEPLLHNATLLFFGNEFLIAKPTTTTPSIPAPPPATTAAADTKDLIHIPYQRIKAVEKLGDRDVMIYFRTFKVTKITTTTKEHAAAIVNNIQSILANATIHDLLAFSFHPVEEVDESNPFATADGWDLYNLETEIERMGVPSVSWRITDINKEFTFCDSYPEKLVVPASVDDSTLLEVAKFRDRRRLPVLSYFYKHSHATICRSGQPLVGNKQNRSSFDEKYFMELGYANPANKKCPSVLDGRTKNTMNYAFNRGGGTEMPKFYGDCRVVQANLEHPYVLSEYLSKLLSACRDRDLQQSDWFSDSGNWLTQVQTVLRMANMIAKAIAKDGTTVLVHCEDDSDTATLFISCAKLLLDPYYRTYTGFQILLEEDWISFGFKFADRCEQIKPDSDSIIKTDYPYFVLFMDCVFQMLHQCQTSFEFNEAYLFAVFENAYNCKYGTFLLNSQYLRKLHNVPKQTTSFWTHLNVRSQREKYTNVFYRPRIQKDGTSILAVDFDARSISFWNGFYNPWSTGSNLQIQLKYGKDPVYAAISERSKKIKLAMQQLKEQVNTLNESLTPSTFDPLGAVATADTTAST